MGVFADLKARPKKPQYLIAFVLMGVLVDLAERPEKPLYLIALDLILPLE